MNLVYQNAEVTIIAELGRIRLLAFLELAQGNVLLNPALN